MEAKVCKYCSQFQALKEGDIFCSKYNPDTTSLENNAFFLKNQKIQMNNGHISRYSLRYSFKGYQHFSIDGYHRTIGSNSMLFLSEGAHFNTDSLADMDVELMTLAFNPVFFEGTLQLSNATHEELLDSPVTDFDTNTDTSFRKINTEIGQTMIDLKQLFSKKHRAAFDSKLESLIVTLFNHKSKQTTNALKKLNIIKKSTKREMIKRLEIGKDFMISQLWTTIKLDDVCREIGMSKYHFIRSFKDYYGLSPHQFLKSERIRFSSTLLNNTNLSISKIAVKAGYESTSSFSRSFREQTGITPLRYRN